MALVCLSPCSCPTPLCHNGSKERRERGRERRKGDGGAEERADKKWEKCCIVKYSIIEQDRKVMRLEEEKNYALGQEKVEANEKASG